MGDAALRVQTRFETAELLLSSVGNALLRGSLRLPVPLKFDSSFEVTLVAVDGNEAVRGTAEIVEDAGHATWIRFLSAAREAPGDDSARFILADVDIDITAPQEAVVEPVAPQGSEAFEAITAVTDRPAALDAIPSGNALPVPLLPPPPPEAIPVPATEGLDPNPPILPTSTHDSISAAVLSVEAQPEPTSDAPAVVETRPSEAMTAPIPVETMAEVIESKPVVASGEVFDSKTEESPAPSNGTAVAVITEEAEAIYVNEKRDTEASPPILLEHRKDSVARERGIEPIAEPYVRESQPVIPSAMPRSRRVVIASMSFAAVCLAVSGGAIIWAQDAVAEAQTKPMANVEASAPLVREEQAQAREAKPAVEQSIELETKPAVVEPSVTVPETCKLSIDASAEDARVSIDGKDRGLAPLTTSVPCGEQMAIAVRHPRYATYERTITVTATDETLHAKLEREKTTVTLTSDPPAAVTLNGMPIGKTPMTYTVSRFEQSTFRFSAPGYETDWRRIMPKSGTSAVVLKLDRQR